ncbi:MAG: (2Fe-2S)-binding protein [Lachnospiraceae bacterium]|nr:(2Fe-2S)-binding protein [Candidatus Equihabitans merdae]
MKDIVVNFTLNGRQCKKLVPANKTLLRFLREDMYINSVKEGCNEGECGACTVLLDGHPVNSCLVLAAELEGKTVLTVEGLTDDDRLHPIQEAFIEAGAVQCGYCTPGMIMSAVACLNLYGHPTREQIRKEMEGNICRCTGYTRIADAILLSVEKMDAIVAEQGADVAFRGIDKNFVEKWNASYEVK